MTGELASGGNRKVTKLEKGIEKNPIKEKKKKTISALQLLC